jgi:hypothetical protein
MQRFSWPVSVVACLIGSSPAWAQQEPPAEPSPNTGQLPEAGQQPPQAGESAAEQPAGPVQPSPSGEPPPPAYEPPPQSYPPQQPGYGQPQPGYSGPGYPGYGQTYEPPPPPPPPPPKSGELPDFSIRIDPVTLLVSGLLNPEFEIELFDYMSLEVVPELVTNTRPPLVNLSGISLVSPGEVLSRHSNGAGPLSGGSIGVGFWPSGKPFEGYVIRALLANWAYEYRTEDAAGGRVDTLKHTNRWLSFYLGSHNRWGFFTIASGFGLRIELNKEERCFTSDAVSSAVTRDCGGRLLLAQDSPITEDPINVNSPLHPIDLFGRLSLGVVF